MAEIIVMELKGKLSGNAFFPGDERGLLVGVTGIERATTGSQGQYSNKKLPM